MIWRTSPLPTNTLELDRRDENIDDIVCSATAAAAPRFADRGVELTTALPPQPITAEVDRQRIDQILANLLENALRHTPSGGSVTVTLAREGEHLSVSVTDTGDGIPQTNSNQSSTVSIAVIDPTVPVWGSRLRVASRLHTAAIWWRSETNNLPAAR
ncbi:hypothetical protein GCM10020255_053940 [Rhodococcus baikonurensis]